MKTILKNKKDDRFVLYALRVSVVGDRSSFVCRHVPGVAFEVIGEDIIFKQKKFSMYSLAALIPFFPAKQRTTHKNDWMTTDAEIACSDPHCGARFKIDRTKEQVFRHSETSALSL